MDPRPRRLLIAVLVALLPGIALAGVGGLRICLSALAGLGDCCEPSADAPSCCSKSTVHSEAPAEMPAEAPGEDDCAWCCVELEQGAPIADASARDGAPIVLALQGLAVGIAPDRSAARPHATRPRSARPPPDGGFNLPLRI